MRQLGRLAVWYPIDRLDAGGIKRLLRTIEDLGYSTFWYPEALGYESLSIASFMLSFEEPLDWMIVSGHRDRLRTRDLASTKQP